MGRVQRGCRGANGDEDAGPGMQGGFKSTDGKEDDGTRMQKEFSSAGGEGGGRGTGRIQRC